MKIKKCRCTTKNSGKYYDALCSAVEVREKKKESYKVMPPVIAFPLLLPLIFLSRWLKRKKKWQGMHIDQWSKSFTTISIIERKLINVSREFDIFLGIFVCPSKRPWRALNSGNAAELENVWLSIGVKWTMSTYGVHKKEQIPINKRKSWLA